ncbi:hypothetical protein Tco_1252750 [Tanacetum coccineum]
MDVAFDSVVGIEDSDSLGYGFDRNMNSWNFGHDILRDILGHNWLHEVHTSACENFEFLHYNRVIGIDVVSIGGNNGFRADLEFTGEIEFEKDFVLEDLKSFVESVIEEDSSDVTNLKKIGNLSVRIRPDSHIILIILNHLYVGALDTKIVRNRELNNSGTRCQSNGPSARSHRLVIRNNDDYGWGIGWCFEFHLGYIDLRRFDEKFLDTVV